MESEVDEDESFQIVAVANVVGFDVHMNDVQQVQPHQGLSQLRLDLLAAGKFLRAELHRELDGVAEDHQIEAEGPLHARPGLDVARDLEDQILL